MNNTLGRARPCAEETSRILGATVAAFPKNFPHAILRAVALLASVGGALPEQLGLAQSDRLVLAAIVRCASVRDPRRSIWAHKTALASSAGLSESTVYRALRRLVDAGLIVRQEQERRNLSGRLSVARVCLTAFAARLLGLVGVPMADGQFPASAPSSPQCPSVSVTDGPIREENLLSEDQQDRSTRQSGTDDVGAPPVATEIPGKPVQTPETPVPAWDAASAPATAGSMLYSSTPPQVGTAALATPSCVPTWDGLRTFRSPNTKTKGSSVPDDLRWLDGVGMPRPMIWRLMAAYTRKGARLGHALSALQPRLYGLPVERIYAYLWTMASRGIDFAALARVAEEDRRETQLAQKQQSREGAALEQLRRPGARFEIVGAPGVWVSDGAFATAAGAVGVLPINGRLAAAVREGRAVLL